MMRKVCVLVCVLVVGLFGVGYGGSFEMYESMGGKVNVLSDGAFVVVFPHQMERVSGQGLCGVVVLDCFPNMVTCKRIVSGGCGRAFSGWHVIYLGLCVDCTRKKSRVFTVGVDRLVGTTLSRVCSVEDWVGDRLTGLISSELGRVLVQEICYW